MLLGPLSGYCGHNAKGCFGRKADVRTTVAACRRTLIANRPKNAILRSMLSREEMFPLLLEADPTFEPKWQTFIEEWADEPDLPHYIVLGELAYHLIEMQRCGRTQRLRQVFKVIERWHAEGDAYVSEAATVGLLEGLQNILGGNKRSKALRGVKSSDFEVYFGPETRRWWEKLYRFWDGDFEALQFDK